MLVIQKGCPFLTCKQKRSIISTKVQIKRREVLFIREMKGNKIIAILFTRSLCLRFTIMDTKKSLFGSSFFFVVWIILKFGPTTYGQPNLGKNFSN